MSRHPINDAHKRINEIPTVPIYYLAKPQAGERGKKILLSTGPHRGPADSRRREPHTRSIPCESSGVKSSVDDLALGQGVVLSRATTTLQSIETKPLD